MRRNKTETISIGVCIGRDVVEYLKSLELDYGCSRSFLINYIVREHAARNLAAEKTKRDLETTPQLAPVIEM